MNGLEKTRAIIGGAATATPAAPSPARAIAWHVNGHGHDGIVEQSRTSMVTSPAQTANGGGGRAAPWKRKFRRKIASERAIRPLSSASAALRQGRGNPPKSPLEHASRIRQSAPAVSIGIASEKTNRLAAIAALNGSHVNVRAARALPTQEIKRGCSDPRRGVNTRRGVSEP